MDKVDLKQYSGIEWYFLAFKQYAVFKGRSTRLAFWFFAAYHIIALILVGIGDLVLAMTFDISYRPLSYLYTLVSIIPCLALTSRRLHDANFSHWWLIGLVPKLIFSLLFWVTVSTDIDFIDDIYFIYFIVALNAIAVIFMLILLIFVLLGSQPGSNKYGPNPYGING